MTVIDNFVQIFLIEGMAFRYGLMIAASIMIGFFLYSNKQNWRWFVSWFAFIVFYAWIATSVCMAIIPETCIPPWQNISFSMLIISVVLYGGSTAAGAYLASVFERREAVCIEAERKVIQNIKIENGISTNRSDNIENWRSVK